MTSVLFVCLGNICRSPAAEGFFRDLLAREGLEHKIVIDSAATHPYNVGRPPDPRMQAAALRRGIDLSTQRARCIAPADFRRFDRVLAMDLANLADLGRLCPAKEHHRLYLFLSLAPELGDEVPDPYHGAKADFERVLDLIDVGARTLLDHLRRAARPT